MVEAADNIESDKRNACAREDQFLARLLFGLWPRLHAPRHQCGIMAHEIEAEHETRESENQPVEPALPVSQRPSGKEDNEREKKLELGQPEKCTLRKIVHREHDRSDIGIDATREPRAISRDRCADRADFDRATSSSALPARHPCRPAARFLS